MAFQGQTRRPLKSSEVRRAVERAYNTTLAPDPNFQKKEKEKWIPRKTNNAFRPSRRTITEADIWDLSPTRIDDGITQRMVLEWLFPDPEGLICVGKSAFEFHTARLSKFKDLTQCQFIVPCYMSSRTGKTQDGKDSMHCLDNCGPRRFFVCDFDEPKSHQHPSIIWHLKDLFHLVMVISSGGKSMHAWFWVDPTQEDDFWKIAVPMGADPALMRNRSSFVRIPMGTRDNGNTQRLFYFNQPPTI